MNKYWKLGLSAFALLASFSLGYFVMPSKIKTVTNTVEVVKVEHSVTTIHEKPDGTKDTTVISDTNTKTDSTTNTVTQTLSKPKNNISGLIGMDSYGISAQREILGPFVIGPWVMTNKQLGDVKYGVSIGVNF